MRQFTGRRSQHCRLHSTRFDPRSLAADRALCPVRPLLPAATAVSACRAAMLPCSCGMWAVCWLRCAWLVHTRIAPRPHNLEPGTRPGGGRLRWDRNRVPGLPYAIYSPFSVGGGRGGHGYLGTRAPEYPGYHTLCLLPYLRLSGGVVRRTRVPYTICFSCGFGSAAW